MMQLLDYLVANAPEFKKARVPVLYSEFHTQQSLNPEKYQINISAWRKALATIARSGLAPPAQGSITPDRLVLDCSERLRRALESKQYGCPPALGAVIRDALADKDLIPLSEFLTSNTSVYYRPWTLSPWNVAAWALAQLGLGGSGSSNTSSDRFPTGRFVVLANVETAAARFAEIVSTFPPRSRFERTLSKIQFKSTFGTQLSVSSNGDKSTPLSDTDIDVLLAFLARDKHVILYDGQCVKLLDSPSSSIDPTITAEDRSIAQLGELIAHLSHQTQLLDQRVADCAAEARAAVAAGNKIKALAAIRSRKHAEAMLATRFRTLHQLEDVAARLEQASDSVQTVAVLESSGASLARLNATVGGVAGVEDVVERLREQMNAADEVTTILGEADPAAAVDEAEVEEGLEMLAREENAREQAEREGREADEVRRRLDGIEGVKVKAREKEEEEKGTEDSEPVGMGTA